MLFHERIEQMMPPPSCVGDFYEVTKKPRNLSVAAFNSVPFVPMDAVPQGGAFDPVYAPKAGSAISSGTYFEAGDLLVAKITPSFENGKQALAKNLPTNFGYATTEVIPLRPKISGQDRRFLFYYLLHPDIRAFVAEKMEGATGRQRVPESVLLDLPFPSFSDADQTAISDVLETVRRAIDAEEKLGRRHAELKRATMCELFTRGLRGEAQKETELGPVPEDWEVVSLGNHFFVGSGGTPSRGNARFWEGGCLPWVKTTEVKYNTILQTEEHITAEGLANSAAKLLPVGTLLMAMYGQGVTRGKVALLGIEATCNQACATMNPLEDGEIETRYLFHFLTYRYEQIRGMAHGGQQQNLNLDIVRDLPVAFPREDGLQAEIVAILDAIDAKIDLHRRKQALLEELFRALLHKLMTGEIRVTDLDLSALETEADA